MKTIRQESMVDIFKFRKPTINVYELNNSLSHTIISLTKRVESATFRQ